MSDSTDKIIAEYSKDYCHFLEAAYGTGMMSEGGAQAIDKMFANTNISNKSMLDIGFGLGGAAFYLADRYNAKVTGVEINPWMVEEATHRCPTSLKHQVEFKLYRPNEPLPLDDEQFDIVFSKGVLTHLDDKMSLFNEVYRTLKPGGLFIIDDWLSPQQGQWGKKLEQMCQTEELTLYAETVPNYVALLQQSSFINIQSRNESEQYYQYNLSITEKLKATPADHFAFSELSREESIASYQLITDSIKDEELLIYWFCAEKPVKKPHQLKEHK